MKNLIKVFCLTFSLVFFDSCHKDTSLPPTPTYNDQGNIGAQGGTVKTSDGAFIEIPAGALSTSQIISITNTTEGDTSVNNGCKIYELKPNGLAFSDSVIITLPFDNKYIDLNSKEENYGIGIMVFQDTAWIKLKTKINLNDKTAKSKTTHFSNYIVYFPYIWSYYYLTLSNSIPKTIEVPYYMQDGKWCAYYSLSMVTKYAGYPYKGPFFAALLDETTPDAGGFDIFKFPSLAQKLKDIGILADISATPWANTTDLCGYILKQLNEGFPVWLDARNLNHAVVITGHDQNGFYFNNPDPGGPRIMDYISYTQFQDGLINLWDFISPLFGGDFTIVIKSSGTESIDGLTLNFRDGIHNLWIKSDLNSFDIKGELHINGKYKPLGYSITNSSNEITTFNGSDYIFINPYVSNSYRNNMILRLHVKIDNKDIVGSPQTLNPVPSRDPQYNANNMITRLSNLQKGVHKIDVELRSADSQLLYDHWSFDLNIGNEFIDNGQPPNPPSIPSPSDRATGILTSTTLSWICSDPDGDPLTYDVYFGTTNNPTIQIGTNLTTKSISQSGLSQGVTYYWKVVAKDNHTNSTSGPIWSFTTAGTPTIPTVTTTAISGITQTIATSGGNVTSSGSTDVIVRGVCWSTSSNPKTTDNVTTDGSGTGSFTSSITGLTAGITYHVRAYAINSAGTAYGSDMPFTTIPSPNTFTDSRDGHTYKWISIGNQVLMAENLAYLPSVNDPSLGSTTDALYYVNGYLGTNVNEAKATTNYQIYGVLYNTPAALNSCPTGWHLPSDAEWATLATYLGGESVAGGKLKEAGTAHWANPNSGATNQSGFTALPAGVRLKDGTFDLSGTNCHFWSSTLIDNYPTYNGRDLINNNSSFLQNDFNADHGLSVRCIKN